MTCPVCGQTWPALERLALVGRVAVSERGAAPLSRTHAEVLACLQNAPVPRTRFAAMFAGGGDQAATALVYRINAHLRPIGWRVRLLARPDGGEAYALTEILRNERGALVR